MPRAELAAVVRAAEAAVGILEVVTDCLSVARGVATIAAGGEPDLARGPLGDLWTRFARCAVEVRWVPSHRDAPDPSVWLKGTQPFWLKRTQLPRDCPTERVRPRRACNPPSVRAAIAWASSPPPSSLVPPLGRPAGGWVCRFFKRASSLPRGC